MASELDQDPWWKRTTVYQIYPRSFCDSDGDGIGDLEGIISKLDYLDDLGVETLWLSPPYKSPQKDFGYDISDYRDIAPEYGSLATMDKLIEEVHDREMKIVLDMVLNHTSDQHPWFIESKSSKYNDRRDWYIWRDGKKPGGKKPPTNWNAVTSGNGWHYDPATDQWFWSQFLAIQPDLNYRNPEVKKEMLDVCRFWLDKGVDGFRLDMISSIYEDVQFRDNPSTWRLLPSKTENAMLFQKPLHTLDHPDTLAFMQELRSVLDEYQPARFMVGEVSGPLPVLKNYLGDKAEGLNLVFIFQALGLKLESGRVRRFLKDVDETFPDPFMPTLVFSNHDRMRRISRLGGSIEKAKLNVALQLTARGVPFIYQGEEIGMEQHKLPLKDTLDVTPKKFIKPPAGYGRVPVWLAQGINNIARAVIGESINRDECRTPMQWDTTPNAGFCPPGVKPWLPVTPSYEERNVAVESTQPDSLLSCYQRFLHAREVSPALNSGTFELLDPGNAKQLVMYARRAPTEEGLQETITILNFSDKPAKVLNMLDDARVLVSTRASYEPLRGNLILLAPWEGIVVSK
ncbi:MAG: alpha-glucosidase [Candidatus Lokiarchaeota archaeon]|nr:alpha-glucosidase [Candidatus Lokiarchaeota archaeon]